MILNSKEITERGFAAIIDAYKKNDIKFEQCKINHDVFLHYDEPNNIPRFSFVKFNNLNEIIAKCSLILSDPYEGYPRFQIDWIVGKEYRGKGIGKQLVLHVIEEFLSLLSSTKGKILFIEAIVDQDNEISKQVARNVLGNEQENLSAKTSSFLKKYQF